MRVEAIIVTTMVLFAVVWGGYSYMNEEDSEERVDDKITFPPDASFECFIHDDLERCWLLYVPDSLEINSTVSLIVDMHGITQNAHEQYLLTDMDRIARENNAIVVYPDGWGNSWNFGPCCDPALEEGIDDFGFIHELVNYTIQEYPIDSNRIYATGWSNGCGMSQSLANRQSDVFAAIACMSMYYLDEDDSSYYPIPIMEIHGTADLIVPYISTVATGIIFAGELWNTGAIQNFYTWRDKNQCSGTFSDYSEETIFYNIRGFTDCTNNAEVSLVTLRGAAHNVYSKDTDGSPGNQGTVDTAQIAWDFLSKFSKETEPENFE